MPEECIRLRRTTLFGWHLKKNEQGEENDREYPSIDILSQDALVSMPLEICERESEYGCIEKYFDSPRWSVTYADNAQQNEFENLTQAAEEAEKYGKLL